MADGYLGFHVTLESDPFPPPTVHPTSARIYRRALALLLLQTNTFECPNHWCTLVAFYIVSCYRNRFFYEGYKFWIE
jgi:hypothetical protein